MIEWCAKCNNRDICICPQVKQTMSICIPDELPPPELEPNGTRTMPPPWYKRLYWRLAYKLKKIIEE